MVTYEHLIKYYLSNNLEDDDSSIPIENRINSLSFSKLESND